MRELIRPALFLVARLGLFLAIVAWVAGQFSLMSNYIGVIQIGTGPQNFVIAQWNPVLLDRIPQPKLDYRPTDDWDVLGMITYKTIAEFIPGVRLCRSPGRSVIHNAIIVRHWLVVTIFGLFNGVLMWVYRKRGKELAADE